MNPTLVAALLGASGLGGILAAIITGVSSRRKLGADATKVITEAAAGVVTTLREEIERERRRNDALTREHESHISHLISAHKLQMDKVGHVLNLHVAWDGVAIQKLGELGVEMPPPPPVLPPDL